MEYMTCFKHCFVHLSTVKNVLGLLGENIIMNKQVPIVLSYPSYTHKTYIVSTVLPLL